METAYSKHEKEVEKFAIASPTQSKLTEQHTLPDIPTCPTSYRIEHLISKR